MRSFILVDVSGEERDEMMDRRQEEENERWNGYPYERR
jgi:hypothetical protein